MLLLSASVLGFEGCCVDSAAVPPAIESGEAVGSTHLLVVGALYSYALGGSAVA